MVCQLNCETPIVDLQPFDGNHSSLRSGCTRSWAELFSDGYFNSTHDLSSPCTSLYSFQTTF